MKGIVIAALLLLPSFVGAEDMALSEFQPPKPIFLVHPDGTYTWLAPKDVVAKALIDEIGGRNKQIAALKSDADRNAARSEAAEKALASCEDKKPEDVKAKEAQAKALAETISALRVEVARLKSENAASAATVARLRKAYQVTVHGRR